MRKKKKGKLEIKLDRCEDIRKRIFLLSELKDNLIFKKDKMINDNDIKYLLGCIDSRRSYLKEVFKQI